MVRSTVPWKDKLPHPFTRLEAEMENLVNRFLGADQPPWMCPDRYTPSADLIETGTAYEVTLDVPGMNAEDLSIDLKGSHLWITGERKEQEDDKEDKTVHHAERRYGQFRRVMALPGKVDDESIVAEYSNGVLTITVPKTEETQTKHIEVKT